MQNESSTFEIGDDLEVHRLGFGAMRITGPEIIGEPEDIEEARRVLERCLELGIDFIDTADSYGPGTSERLVRETLEPYPDELVVATKGGHLRNPSGDWIRHGDPDYLVDAVLSSVDRLGVETIDLYQLHRIDPDVPLEESLSALGEMKDKGYIEHIGLSEVSVEELEEAREMIDVVTVQNRYNVNYREHDDVLDFCEEEDIGFIPWFPVASGNFGEKEEDLKEVAENHDSTVYQVAIAWLLQKSEVMLPIPGTSSVEHLEDNVAASQIELTEDEMRKLS